jgi:hypothetical protein
VKLSISRRLIVALMVLVLLVPAQASAESPYEGYIWNSLDRDTHSINGYLYLDSIDGYDMDTGPFKAPEDLYVASNDTLYFVDSGNNRIIHMDSNKNVFKIVGDKDGPGKLNGPKGIFVKRDGTIYVADTQNRRIAIFDKDGKFMRDLPAPNSPLLGKKFVYSPSKLAVDKRDYFIVASDGAGQGLMQIDPNGEFKGFYGANHVGFSWKRLFIKYFATDDQRAQLASVRPMEFSNLYQDQEGFIYTTTLGIEMNQVKRLSAVGVDTLNIGEEKPYGDIFSFGSFEIPAFVDLTVDSKGVITALDQSTNKAFQYDKLGNLLFIFGGFGDQDGLFKTAVSIDQTSDGTMYVVDKTRSRIDRFRKTPFAEIVHEASGLYVDGRYDEAYKPWLKVLDLNSNYDMAYQAIGKAKFKEEHYGEAMKYFKLGRSREDYSVAFREYRKEYMRNNFEYIVALLAGIYIFFKFGLPRIIKLARRTWIKMDKQGTVMSEGRGN